MTLTRSLHVITDGAGQYLVELSEGEPVWSPMPTRAIRAGLSWINSDTAKTRCQHLRELYPARPWGIARVMLELRTASHEWVPVRVLAWTSDDTPLAEEALS